MRLDLLCLLLSAVSTTLALATRSASHVVHETRELRTSRWVKRDRISGLSLMPVRIGLAQQGLEAAQQHLLDISDPDSTNYGRHWTSDDVVNYFKPSDESVAAVRAWLEESGISAHRVELSSNKGWLGFDATASEAEHLLKTPFHEYEDIQTGKVSPGCDEYSLPKHIRPHVDYVTPGIRLLGSRTSSFKAHKRDAAVKAAPGHTQPLAERTDPDNLDTCDVTITPACIRALYQIPLPGSRPSHKDNSLGIHETELQPYTQVDLDLFFKNLTKNRIPQGVHPIDVNIDGGQASTKDINQAGGEANLDLQLAYPIVYPQTITVYNIDDPHYQADPNDTYTWGYNTFLDALDASYCTYSAYGETGDADIDPHYPDPAPDGFKGQRQCGGVKATNVISFSYLGQEVDVPISYMKRQCNEFMKLGLQGVSIIFASGDAGVGNYPAPYGFDGETGCIGPKSNVFNPTWPLNCPWVTGVGATKVYPGKKVTDPESAAFDPAGHPYHVDYSSGGGFSNVYPVPDYQKAAVDKFFADHKPSYPSYSGFAEGLGDVHPGVDKLAAGGGLYNRIGRGIPDVSANGDNIGYYNGSLYHQWGGTSAATPIFSSVINRINEERLAAGKKPVGFLNQALYKMPSVLNDITNGTNPGCGTVGFSAVPGWDPVTGLGTPNYPRMLAYFQSLP